MSRRWLVPAVGALVLAAALSTHPGGARGSVQVPPAPEVRLPAASLTGVDALPLVVLAGPDDADRRSFAAWQRATLRDASPLVEMLELAVGGLTTTDDRVAIDALVAVIDDDPDELLTSDGAALVERAVASVVADRANADRLTNAAVAAWAIGSVVAIDDPEDDAVDLRPAAFVLLERTAARFPDHRAALLDLALFATITPGLDRAGERWAAAAVARDPDDATARALLASIQAADGRTIDGVDRALTTLEPLTEAPESILGAALVGDAHLAAAAIHRAAAPGFARHHAAQAVEAYDRALLPGPDPGLLAGRARALEILGDPAAARAELDRATTLAPSSVDLAIDRARLHQAAGGDLDATADAAIALIDGGWDPSLAEVRWVPAASDTPIPPDRGLLGWSLGSDRDHLPVVVPPDDDGAGAGGVIILGPLDARRPGSDHALVTGLGPRAAWTLSLSAAVLEGDAAGARRLAAAWDRELPWSGSWDAWVAAARLVADPAAVREDGEGTPDGLAIATDVFAAAQRPDEAAALCRAVGDLACAGERSLLAGDPDAAASDLTAAIAAAVEGGDRVDPSDRVALGMANEARGDRSAALRAFAATAGDDRAGRWRVVAAIRAGDLSLDEDPGGAVAWYDLALATIETNALGEVREYHRDMAGALEVRGMEAVAHNNRAVARLRSLQAGPDAAPSCAGSVARARCAMALADATRATEVDPMSAASWMNVGWAARVSGDLARAREALSAAARLDPSLHPAVNDLGVALAQAGELAGASEAFAAAVAAAPEYDLARWNLGIARSADWPAGLLEGQVALAHAIRSDPTLAAAPLAYRSDEHTYRFAFESGEAAPSGPALGRSFSVGAVVLAGAGTVVALAQLQAAVAGSALGTATGGLEGWFARQARTARVRSRVRRLRRRWPAPIGGAWLPWTGALVALAIVSAWQAAHAAPAVAPAAVTFTLLAAALAVVAHAVGHWVAARVMGGRVIPAAWTTGAAVAVAFLPLQAASGPFLAERIRFPVGGKQRAWRFHLAGPVANALVGAVLYAGFVVLPMPFLRLASEVQLAAIAYALLPIQPLDGAVLRRRQPRLHLVLGLGVVAAGSAFALGLL